MINGFLMNQAVDLTWRFYKSIGNEWKPFSESKYQFSCSVMSDSLWPHGLQHTRLPCPSPTPEAYSNSCPLRPWCHPTISSSIIPFSSCVQSFPASGSFPVGSLHQVTKILESKYSDLLYLEFVVHSLKSCPTLCDPMDCSTSGFPALHHFLEFAQIHVHWIGNIIQPSHSLSPPSPSALNLSQHQGLFQRVGSLHQVANVVECQHWSYWWIFKADFL